MSSLSCPIDLDTRKLQTEIRAMYARVAEDPSGDFHFHRGARYAAERLGYDAGALAELPDSTTSSFAGVGNPHSVGAIQVGATVLDIGSGAGTDLLLAARAVGARGHAIGVDATPEMIARARSAAASLGWTHVEVREGDLHALPIEDASIDVVISNGVLNLAHDKRTAFAEIFRVLRPSGRLQLADIVVEAELSEGIRRNVELWTA